MDYLEEIDDERAVRELRRNAEFNRWVTQELQDAHSEVVEHRERIEEIEGKVENLKKEVDSTNRQLVDLGTRVRQIEEHWDEVQDEVQLKWEKINEVRETLQEKGLWSASEN